MLMKQKVNNEVTNDSPIALAPTVFRSISLISFFYIFMAAAMLISGSHEFPRTISITRPTVFGFDTPVSRTPL